MVAKQIKPFQPNHPSTKLNQLMMILPGQANEINRENSDFSVRNFLTNDKKNPAGCPGGVLVC
jgi:hypothetical protein